MRPLYKKLIILSPMTALLTGCVNTLFSHDDCHSINWQQLGYVDGTSGRNRSDLAHKFAHCGPKLVINKTSYELGWHTGVKRYCMARNGLKLGMEGKVYNDICPSNQVSAFDKAWRQGIRDYCTPSNGFKRAIEGKPYPGYCPPDLNTAFKRAYQRGYPVYKRIVAAKSAFQKLQRQYDVLNTDIEEKTTILEKNQARFAKAPFSPEQQYLIQKQKIEIKHMRQKAVDLEKQRNAAKQRLTAIKNHYYKSDITSN